MAEQKFLGEAGTDVLVQRIKANESSLANKLEDHQTFFQMWKADLYTYVEDYSNWAEADMSTKEFLGYIVYTKGVYIVNNLQYVIEQIHLTDSKSPCKQAIEDVIESIESIVSTGIGDCTPVELKNKVDAIFTSDFESDTPGINFEKYMSIAPIYVQTHILIPPADNEVRWTTPTAGGNTTLCYYNHSLNSWIAIPMGSAAPAELTAADVNAKFA